MFLNPPEAPQGPAAMGKGEQVCEVGVASRGTRLSPPALPGASSPPQHHGAAAPALPSARAPRSEAGAQGLRVGGPGMGTTSGRQRAPKGTPPSHRPSPKHPGEGAGSWRSWSSSADRLRAPAATEGSGWDALSRGGTGTGTGTGTPAAVSERPPVAQPRPGALSTTAAVAAGAGSAETRLPRPAALETTRTRGPRGTIPARWTQQGWLAARPGSCFPAGRQSGAGGQARLLPGEGCGERASRQTQPPAAAAAPGGGRS